VGAVAALSGDEAWQRALVATYERGQAALLSELAPGRVIPAEGGYYCLLDTRPMLAETFATGLLAAEGVAVTPMRGWGSDDFGASFVRLIFTNEPEDRLREAGRRIARFSASR
jgi:aspartate/methionine/tyrosine aminotransferase